LVADCGEGGAVARPLRISYPGTFCKAILVEIDEYAKRAFALPSFKPGEGGNCSRIAKKKIDAMEKRFPTVNNEDLTPIFL